MLFSSVYHALWSRPLPSNPSTLMSCVFVFKSRLCVWWKCSLCLSHRFVFWDRVSRGRGAADLEIVSVILPVPPEDWGCRCEPPLVVHLHSGRKDLRLEWKPGGGGACLGRQRPSCLQSEFQDSQSCQSCFTEKPCLRSTNKEGLEWKLLVTVLFRSQRVVVISRRGSQMVITPRKVAGWLREVLSSWVLPTLSSTDSSELRRCAVFTWKCWWFPGRTYVFSVTVVELQLLTSWKVFPITLLSATYSDLERRKKKSKSQCGIDWIFCSTHHMLGSC